MKALRENKKWACWPTKTYAIDHVKEWFTETDQPPAEPAQPRPAKRQRTTSQPSESSDWNQRTTEYLITTMQKHKEELDAVAQLMTYIIYCYYLQWQGTLVPIYVGQTCRDIATRDKEHLDCGRNGTEFEKFLHVFHKDIVVHEMERNEKCTKDWGSDNDRCFWADEREYWHICDKKTHTGLEHVMSRLTGFNKIKVAHAKDIVKYWKDKHEKANKLFGGTTFIQDNSTEENFKLKPLKLLSQLSIKGIKPLLKTLCQKKYIKLLKVQLMTAQITPAPNFIL